MTFDEWWETIQPHRIKMTPWALAKNAWDASNEARRNQPKIVQQCIDIDYSKVMNDEQ